GSVLAQTRAVVVRSLTLHTCNTGAERYARRGVYEQARVAEALIAMFETSRIINACRQPTSPSRRVWIPPPALQPGERDSTITRTLQQPNLTHSWPGHGHVNAARELSTASPTANGNSSDDG
ncbi:unnamed protein product, partial [Ectocarpus sp. 8 AP-2014]